MRDPREIKLYVEEAQQSSDPKTYTVRDVFLAALLHYLGYELIKATLVGYGKLDWQFVCPCEDGKIVAEDFYAGRQGISDVKAFVHAFNILTKTSRDMRQSSQTEWIAPKPESWWAAARQQLEARRKN
jgi:hypothetical protein